MTGRGLCHRCYQRAWKEGRLQGAPRVERDPEQQLSEHFDVRLRKSEAAVLNKLSRVRGQTLAAVLREAIVEYLGKFPIGTAG